MIKETERTETIIEKHRYCDICEARAKTHCCKCNKDICNKCVAHEDYDWGDHRGDCYCDTCWQKGTPIREKITKLEQQIDELHEQWNRECRNEEI